MGAVLENIEKAAFERNIDKARAEKSNLKEAIAQIEKHCSTLGTYKSGSLEG